MTDARLSLAANLSDRTIAVQSREVRGSPIWGKPGDAMKPWSVLWHLEDTLMPSGTPIATYRLQLTANFDFDAAAAIVPYLKALGISHVYASPFTKARKGSTHGYDVVNHTLINPNSAATKVSSG